MSNWCSYDLSVVDLATAKEVKRIPLGPYPRGIGTGPRHVMISPDGKALYATLNSEGKVVKIDAATGNIWVACYVGTIMVFTDK